MTKTQVIKDIAALRVKQMRYPRNLAEIARKHGLPKNYIYSFYLNNKKDDIAAEIKNQTQKKG